MRSDCGYWVLVYHMNFLGASFSEMTQHSQTTKLCIGVLHRVLKNPYCSSEIKTVKVHLTKCSCQRNFTSKIRLEINFALKGLGVKYSQTCLIRPSLIRLTSSPLKNGLGPIFYHWKQC